MQAVASKSFRMSPSGLQTRETQGPFTAFRRLMPMAKGGLGLGGHRVGCIHSSRASTYGPSLWAGAAPGAGTPGESIRARNQKAVSR